jgi:transposase
MKQKYHVRLSGAERIRVQEEQVRGDTPETIRRRCSVLLLTDENVGKPGTHKEIANRVGVSEALVETLCKQYVTQGVDYCLRRQKHDVPPRARITSGEKEARIIAMACGEPPQGYSRWTVRLLRDKVVELEIMETVSRETIHRILKKRNLSLI